MANQLIITCLHFLCSVGSATRRCNENGEWSEPDVLECLSVVFANIFNEVHTKKSLTTSTIDICMQAMEALSSEDPMEQLQASMEFTSQLLEATAQHTVSLLPADLWVANVVLDNVVNIQEDIVRQNGTVNGAYRPDEVCYLSR